MIVSRLFHDARLVRAVFSVLVLAQLGSPAADSAGRALWESPTAQEVDSAFSAGDVDNDGRVDIFVIDLGGTLYRLDSTGKEVWRGSVGKRARRSPALVDLDADGSAEIVAGSYAGAVYVFNAKGEEIQRIALKGACNATPTFVDLDGSGAPALVIPASVGLLSAFVWPNPKGEVRAFWPEYRGSSLRTGVAAPLVRVDASRRATSTSKERVASFQKRLETGLTELDATAAALGQRIPNLTETEIDVWCPARPAYLQGDKSEMHLSMMRLREKPDCAPGERLALMHEDAQTWTYDCMDKAKNMSPIGYYRAIAWNAWSRDVRGIGFWTWARGEDLWFFPKQTFIDEVRKHIAETFSALEK